MKTDVEDWTCMKDEETGRWVDVLPYTGGKDEGEVADYLRELQNLGRLTMVSFFLVFFSSSVRLVSSSGVRVTLHSSSSSSAAAAPNTEPHPIP